MNAKIVPNIQTCHNYVHHIKVRKGMLVLRCWRCGKPEYQHTSSRIQAMRSLSLKLRSLLKLMKVSITHILLKVKVKNNE